MSLASHFCLSLSLSFSSFRFFPAILPISALPHPVASASPLRRLRKQAQPNQTANNEALFGGGFACVSITIVPFFPAAALSLPVFRLLAFPHPHPWLCLPPTGIPSRSHARHAPSISIHSY